MPVITDHKSFDEIHSNLLNRGDLSIAVIGCEDGARGCYTGGSKKSGKFGIESKPAI